MSVRQIDEDYFSIEAPRKQPRISSVLATTSTAARVDPASLRVETVVDGSIFVSRIDGNTMGRFALINGRSHECTNIVVRAMSSKESDSTPSNTIIVETFDKSGLRGPELRQNGLELTVFDLNGKQYDAWEAATAFGSPVSTGLVLYVRAAVEAYRQRARVV
jgi:hypothetical protein